MGINTLSESGRAMTDNNMEKMKPARETQPVDRGIGNLNRSIGRLQERLENLKIGLGPVMSRGPMLEGAAPPSAPMEDGMSPLAEDLQSKAQWVDRLVEDVDHMLSRIEL